MIMIDGTVETIIFSNKENGYTVCDVASAGQLITMTGYMPNLTEGERIEAHGDWVTHIEYGDQFEVEYYERHMPSTEAEIEKFLASGILPGIGKATAKKIVKFFGADALEVIEKEPDKLLVISGLSKKKTDEIYKKYIELIGLREVIMFFQKFNVSPSSAVRAYKILGENTVNAVRENPYVLAECVDGITFMVSDSIATELGFGKNSFERISCGIKFLMRKLGYLNGHTYLPSSAVVNYAVQNLEVSQGDIENAISDMTARGDLIKQNMGEYDAVYLKEFYDAEKRVATKLIEMSELVYDTDITSTDKMINEIEEKNSILLAESQLNAVRSVMRNSVMVITGGPGTGKTTIIKTIIELMERLNKRVMLAAPMGRAAKRMTEVCGREAKTIHRLLEITPGENEVGNKFARNENNKLDCDVLVIDEMSMVDIMLMDSLLLAIHRGTRLIMVGDAEQLPSVGAGNVLKDIIESDSIDCIKLTEIFRQARESMIVVNAHRINHGEMPHINDFDNDFFLVERDDIMTIPETIADLCARRLPKKYGFNGITQIQVLTPTRKSIIGVTNLNAILQDKLNPASPEKAEYMTQRCVFRVGDKVMQTKNNYQIEWEKLNSPEVGQGVFNGDVGYISEISKAAQRLTVIFDDRKVEYDFMLLDDIELAYAATVHKSQGSEFDAVIIPMCETHRLLMTRNLLYTAITRAKRLVVLVGNEETIKVYVNNDNVQRRFSGLKNRMTVF